MDYQKSDKFLILKEIQKRLQCLFFGFAQTLKILHFLFLFTRKESGREGYAIEKGYNLKAAVNSQCNAQGQVFTISSPGEIVNPNNKITMFLML